MLKIYDVILDVARQVRPVIVEIERKDPDLGRQMRRALCSVALNSSEAMYSRGKNRPARFHVAMGSMRETLACIEIGIALGYVRDVDAATLRQIDRIVATLYKLSA